MAEKLDFYTKDTILRISSYVGTNHLFSEQILPEDIDSDYGVGQILTIDNISKSPLADYQQIVNTVTYPNALKYIVENGYGITAGEYSDGNNVYPIVQFNPKRFLETDPVGLKSYEYYNGLTEKDREFAYKAYTSFLDTYKAYTSSRTDLSERKSKKQKENYER